MTDVIHIFDILRPKRIELELLVYSFKNDGKSLFFLLTLYVFQRKKFREYVSHDTNLNLKIIPLDDEELSLARSKSSIVYSPFSEKFNQKFNYTIGEEVRISNDKKYYIKPSKNSLKIDVLKKMMILLKMMRVEQWVKCILVLSPLLLAHEFNNLELWKNAIVGMLMFCLMASSVYILNDFFDVWDDRANQEKKTRPLASSLLSAYELVLFFVLLQVLIFVVLSNIGLQGASFLYLYLFLNILYSLKIKIIFLLDVIVLTSFYIIRILFGAIVVGVIVSDWLLIFSFFIFFSLSLLKRFIELNSNFKYAGNSRLSSRDYNLSDQPIILGAGICSGVISSLILALYIKFGTGSVEYTSPRFLWGAVIIILYWILYMWMKALRGYMKYDPVKFAVRDKLSWFLLILTVTFGYFSL